MYAGDKLEVYMLHKIKYRGGDCTYLKFKTYHILLICIYTITLTKTFLINFQIKSFNNFYKLKFNITAIAVSKIIQ